MRKTSFLFFVILATWAALPFAAAQMIGEGSWGHTPAAFKNYVGPGDIATGASGWYGLRAYNFTYAQPGTNPAAIIRRASDNTTTTLAILTNANIDTPSATTFCNGTTCFIQKLFDQTGNGQHLTQTATNARQPPFLLAGCVSGGKPCISCTNDDNVSFTTMTGVINVSGQQPFTFSTVVSVNTFPAGNNSTMSIFSLGNNTTHPFEINFQMLSQIPYIQLESQNTANIQILGSSYYAAAGRLFDPNSAFIVNTTNDGSIGFLPNVANNATNIHLCESGNTIFTQQFQGNIEEVGFWQSATLSSGQMQNIINNQRNFWGF